MKRLLLWLWQLPQNLLGFIYTLPMNKRYHYDKEKGVWFTDLNPSAVSLGDYIIMMKHYPNNLKPITIKHEKGHQKQSKLLGPLYLIIIGIPSFIWSLLSIFVPRRWYYKFPAEAWADKLGGVSKIERDRFY